MYFIGIVLLLALLALSVLMFLKEGTVAMRNSAAEAEPEPVPVETKEEGGDK
ncbi:hypothetical protein [Dinoroseobacter sp. S76]|uniref:hypothetical protein n=1 Tax=Dinoroseobacter sp. S76 TaxID=3415124 RepID=UPI003C7BF6A8